MDLRKNDFIGRDALIEEQRAGPARKRVIFRVDANGVDALANEPVLCDGETVGWVTSAASAITSTRASRSATCRAR